MCLRSWFTRNIKFIICFQDIVNNLFTSQNFSTIDVNSDGSLTIDEFFDELMTMPWPIPAGTYLQAYSGSSDVSILNAALCICDTDNSATLDINEINTDQCQLVQDWMLGQIISGVYFTMGDSNGDGFIDIQEALAAFQLLG